MGFILKLLGGALGPWISGGIAVALAVGLLGSCVQTKRVNGLKEQVAKAQALASLNYQRAMEWREVVLGPDGWKAAYARLDLRRRQENADTARIIEAATQSHSRATSSAFDQGYAAGRAVGLRSRGAPNATTAPPGAADAGGVRDNDPGDDLATVFRKSAYRYAARLSANP